MRFSLYRQAQEWAAVWRFVVLEQLLDVNDVAKFTKLSVAVIRKYVLLHQIPFHKIFKAVRFRPSEIDEWINRNGGPVAMELLEGEDLFSAAALADEAGGGNDGNR
jgi:predicted DNA-binding transcriptional regulator AlpA